MIGAYRDHLGFRIWPPIARRDQAQRNQAKIQQNPRNRADIFPHLGTHETDGRPRVLDWRRHVSCACHRLGPLRDMSAHVIQHTKPRRKRAHARSWTARHLLLLGVVIVAIIAASWLAPEIAAPPQRASTSHEVAAQAPAAPETSTVDVAADLARPARAPARVRQITRHTGVPLDAAVAPSDEYEILSAAELAAISQAHN